MVKSRRGRSKNRESGKSESRKNMNLKSKTVLVTGSTDGVGRLVAHRLADQGARVLSMGGTGSEASNWSTISPRPATARQPSSSQIFHRSPRCVVSPALLAKNVNGSTF